MSCSIENHKGEILKSHRQILNKKIFYKILILNKKKRRFYNLTIKYLVFFLFKAEYFIIIIVFSIFCYYKNVYCI